MSLCLWINVADAASVGCSGGDGSLVGCAQHTKMRMIATRFTLSTILLVLTSVAAYAAAYREDQLSAQRLGQAVDGFHLAVDEQRYEDAYQIAARAQQEFSQNHVVHALACKAYVLHSMRSCGLDGGCCMGITAMDESELERWLGDVREGNIVDRQARIADAME